MSTRYLTTPNHAKRMNAKSPKKKQPPPVPETDKFWHWEDEIADEKEALGYFPSESDDMARDMATWHIRKPDFPSESDDHDYDRAVMFCQRQFHGAK